MELVTSAAGAGDVTKLTDVITLLLQSSAKARLVYYTKKGLFFFITITRALLTRIHETIRLNINVLQF